MFYEGAARDGRRSIGVAVSRDGQTGWTRHPQPILGPSEEAGSWDGASVGAPCAVPMAGGLLWPPCRPLLEAAVPIPLWPLQVAGLHLGVSVLDHQVQGGDSLSSHAAGWLADVRLQCCSSFGCSWSGHAGLRMDEGHSSKAELTIASSTLHMEPCWQQACQ